MAAQSSGVASRLSDLVSNLVTIEVTTVVKANISGNKMPQAEHALMDIAVELWQFLIGNGFVAPKSDAEWDRDIHAGWASWDACRGKAREACSKLIAPEKPDQCVAFEVLCGKLQRIVYACDQMKGILYDISKIAGATTGGQPSPCGEDCRIARDRTTGAINHQHGGKDVVYAQAPPKADGRWMPLEPQQRAVLRKIWEVMLEEIALQTVIQLDGDIVTRVHPVHLGNDRVIALHNQGVQLSQTIWKELADIAFQLFDTLAKFLKS